MHFYENIVFNFQTTFSLFYGFNVLLSFLAEKQYRTKVKLPQKLSFGAEACEIIPKVAISPLKIPPSFTEHLFEGTLDVILECNVAATPSKTQLWFLFICTLESYRVPTTLPGPDYTKYPITRLPDCIYRLHIHLPFHIYPITSTRLHLHNIFVPDYPITFTRQQPD